MLQAEKMSIHMSHASQSVSSSCKPDSFGGKVAGHKHSCGKKATANLNAD